MFTIIFTVAMCYFAVGIYTLIIFDEADARKGLEQGSLFTQARVILTWPGFLYFVANVDEYEVNIGDWHDD